MPNNLASPELELYPVERVLLVGPLFDVRPLADRCAAAGHTVTLLLPEDDIEIAGRKYRVLDREEAVEGDEYDLALELHCTSLEAKADALLYLEDSLNEETPLLTYTFAISAGELARELMMPERVVGVSLLPPFGEATLVEIMATPHTRLEALSAADRFFESIGLGRAQVADGPGGVLGRTVCCLVNEAAFALGERIATAEEIDRAMQLGVSYPRGPLAWGDHIGLDRVLAVLDGLYAEYKDERYRPAPMLRKLVRAGLTGVRAGTGFYTHRGA